MDYPHYIYLGLSAVAQVLFAVSAIPFYLDFKASQVRTWKLFEWTWYVAEVFMILGSVGLARYELLPGLVINFIFLSLCLPKHFENREREKEIHELLDIFMEKKGEVDLPKDDKATEGTTEVPGNTTKH